MSTTRRSLLLAAATSTAFAALPRTASATALRRSRKYGPLRPDPEGFLELPEGFSYHVLSSAGESMNDGFFVPEKHDGMAAFPGPNGTTILVRNHELAQDNNGGAFGESSELLSKARGRLFDPGQRGAGPCLGGTTTVVYDTAKNELVSHHLSLAGTMQNCAGGATPWGSWISCEEWVGSAGGKFTRDHGWCFEVPSQATELVDPEPLTALGRFMHEAVAIDPRTNIVYLTEDRHDSLLYRLLPNEPGKLAAGGRLQALSVHAAPSLDMRNWHRHTHIEPGQALEVRWVDLDQPESPADDLRLRGFSAGAARFARGEGIAMGAGEIFFTCTIGGAAQLGQVWRYRPSQLEGKPKEKKEAGTIELFYESTDASLLERCDNLTVAPWGDLIVCEDGADNDRVQGITPDGHIYSIANNVESPTEFAGATFSPDGKTLFVNAQGLGRTVAISGPWV